MRNHTLTTVLIILLVMPVLAGAASIDSVSGTADCNGWSADLAVSFRPGAFFVQMQYSVVVQDANGDEVDRFDDATFVTIPEASTASYNFTGAWTSELDGNYTVVGEFIMHDMFDGGQNVTSATFLSDLACGASAGDDPFAGEPCLYPARYWHRHPELWPVTSMEIRGRILDQEQLMVVMNHRVHRFTLFALTRELITAKLNLANGGNSDIQDIVDATEALLMDFTGNLRSRGQARREANRLKRALHAYNKSGCPGDGTSGVTLSFDGGSNSSWDDSADKETIEVMTLGTIKAMYR